MARTGNKAASARLPMYGLDTLHECHYGGGEYNGQEGLFVSDSWTQHGNCKIENMDRKSALQTDTL